MFHPGGGRGGGGVVNCNAYYRAFEHIRDIALDSCLNGDDAMAGNGNLHLVMRSWYLEKGIPM